MKKSKLKIVILLIKVLSVIIMSLLIGILIGMNIGGMAVIHQLVYGFSGNTIIVQFNETKMVDLAMRQFNETILPQIKTPHEIEHNLNLNAGCPKPGENKTVAQCIIEYEESQRS